MLLKCQYLSKKKEITNREKKKRNQSVIRGSFVGSENRMSQWVTWGSFVGSENRMSRWVTWCSNEQWDSMNTQLAMSDWE